MTSSTGGERPRAAAGRSSAGGPATRLEVPVVSIAVSAVALVLLVVHLVWPDLEVDSTAIALLVIALVPWLGPIFKSIELPGGWKFEFQELRRELQQELAKEGARIDQIDDRIRRLELEVTGGTPDQHALLQSVLDRFDVYLGNLGFERPPTPKVRIEETGYDNAHFDGRVPEIVMGGRLSDDPDVMMREYGHAVLLAGVELPQLTPTGGLRAIESGVVDYLICSYNDTPKMGVIAAKALRVPDGHIRDLDNELILSAVEGQPEQRIGELWGGVFWTLRRAFGAGVVDRAVAATWRTASRTARGQDSAFVTALLSELEARGGAAAREAGAAELERRGIDTPDLR